jgi:hypothetical protein
VTNCVKKSARKMASLWNVIDKVVLNENYIKSIVTVVLPAKREKKIFAYAKFLYRYNYVLRKNITQLEKVSSVSATLKFFFHLKRVDSHDFSR